MQFATRFHPNPLLAFLLTVAVCCAYLLPQKMQAQCANYTQTSPATLPDACNTAVSLASVINTCQKVCINTALATGGTSPMPNCGSGVLTNDVWVSLTNPYANIPAYDGSLVFAWKNYPQYPAYNPTVATHLEASGSLTLTTFPFFLPLSINCSDGFAIPNLTCTDTSAIDYGQQLVLQAGSIPTNAALELLLESDASVNNATLTGTATWFQIETYNNMPGLICFEVSTYHSGFSCGDPNIVTFSGSGNSETQTVSGCLCTSAQNSGYYNPSNTPCPGSAATYTGTAAYYQINAPYLCNQIETRLISWSGAGNVNVTILGEVACPEIVNTDANGTVTTTPGLVVESATLLAENCLNPTSNNLLSTPNTTCLPAGTYYVLVMGSTDKDNYTLGITVKDNSPVLVKATAILEGAYTGSSMTTNLSTNQQLPLTQPFNRPPWNYTGTESVANAAAIPTNTVDWVLLEVRDALNKTLVIERKAAFLLSNGAIVDVNGIANGVNFYFLTPNTNYHLAIKHRNHLGAITANAVQLPNASPINFTNAATAQAAALGQLVNTGGGVYALRAGDINADGIISYADFNSYTSQLFGISPYRDADCNLSGTVSIVDFGSLRPNIGTIGLNSIRP